MKTAYQRNTTEGNCLSAVGSAFRRRISQYTVLARLTCEGVYTCISEIYQLYLRMWFRQVSYEAVFDPLDGSRNIDAGIPTGTIFGIYKASGGSQVPSNIVHHAYIILHAG